MDLNQQLTDSLAQAKAYFEQLTEYEQYAWAAEGVGFLLFVIGAWMLLF